MPKTRIVLLVAYLMSSGAMELCLGQGTTATISGNITDGTGAVIHGAKVTATNLETNVARTVATQADGSYALLFLPIGTYRIEIAAPGFKRFEQTGIVLEVSRNAKVDAAHKSER